MAKATTISKGALVLSTDSAQLQKGLDDARKKISGFNISLNQGLSFFTTGPLGGAIAGVKLFASEISQAGDKAEQMMNLAESFGTTAENLQAVSLAANLAGVETESLTKALRVAGELAGEASLGTAEAAKKLGLLGLVPGDIAGRDPVEVLTLLLDKLQQIGDVGKQLKTAGDIFGGKNSLQALTLMRAELGKTADELKRSGAIMRTDTAKALDELGDKFTKFISILANFKNELLGEVSKRILGNDFKTVDQQIDDLTKQITDTYAKLELPSKIANRPMEENILAGYSEDEIRAYVSEFTRLSDALVVLESKLDLLRTQRAADIIGAQDDARIAKSAAATESLAKSVFNLALATAEFEDAYAEGLAKALDGLKAENPLANFQLAIANLQAGLEAGMLSAEEFDLAFFKAFQSLSALVDKASEFKLPSAILAGSSQAISARNQFDMQRRFGGDNGNDVKGVIKAIEDQNKDEVRRARELITELKNLPGGIAGVFKQI